MQWHVVYPLELLTERLFLDNGCLATHKTRFTIFKKVNISALFCILVWIATVACNDKRSCLSNPIKGHKLWIYFALCRDLHDEISTDAHLTIYIDFSSKFMDKISTYAEP